MRSHLAASVILGLVAIFSAASSGCTPVHVLVEPRVPENDVVVKPALAQFLKTPGEKKIVLRVPVPQGQLTAEDVKASEAMNPVYNSIEKELLKKGFTVRDRALLAEVLRSNPTIDYRTIKEKIDTQLILEIVSFTKWDYSNAQYKRVADGVPGTSHVPFALYGSRVMAKLILVETGEIGAIVTYHPWPKDWECYFVMIEGSDPIQVNTANKGGVPDERYSGYTVPNELGAAVFVQEMLKEIQK